MFRKRGLLVVVVGMGVLLGGCAGAKVKGPSDQELVSQVMHEWKAAWEGKDVERIMACLSPSFSTSDGDGPDAIRGFAAGYSERAEARMEMLLDEMEISIAEETASVRGLHGTMSGRDEEGNESEWNFGQSTGLRKEEGKWLITWIDVWNIEG